MAHRLHTTLPEFLAIEEQATSTILVDDDGYMSGDFVHIAYHEGDRLKWLLVRKVTEVDRTRKGLEPGFCILTLN